MSAYIAIITKMKTWLMNWNTENPTSSRPLLKILDRDTELIWNDSYIQTLLCCVGGSSSACYKNHEFYLTPSINDYFRALKISKFSKI